MPKFKVSKISFLCSNILRQVIDDKAALVTNDDGTQGVGISLNKTCAGTTVLRLLNKTVEDFIAKASNDVKAIIAWALKPEIIRASERVLMSNEKEFECYLEHYTEEENKQQSAIHGIDNESVVRVSFFVIM
jgi:hypothetical protein